MSIIDTIYYFKSDVKFLKAARPPPYPIKAPKPNNYCFDRRNGMKYNQSDKYMDEINSLSVALELIDYRPSTIEGYLQSIYECCEWLDLNKNLTINEASYIEFREFLISLKKIRGLKPRTINIYNCAIKKYSRFVLLKPLGSDELPTMKVDVILPKVPNKKDVFLLILGTNNIKHQAELAIAYGCALRLGEVVSLRFKDISFTDMTVTISADVSKSRHAGVVPLPGRAKKILYQYWKECCRGMKPDDWLFPGQKPGTHISKGAVGRVFHKRLKELGWENRGYTFHSLRHAHALHYYQAGADLFQVKERLRHRSINSSIIYVQLDATLHGRKEIENPFDDPAY